MPRFRPPPSRGSPSRSGASLRAALCLGPSTRSTARSDAEQAVGVEPIGHLGGTAGRAHRLRRPLRPRARRSPWRSTGTMNRRRYSSRHLKRSRRIGEPDRPCPRSQASSPSSNPGAHYAPDVRGPSRGEPQRFLQLTSSTPRGECPTDPSCHQTERTQSNRLKSAPASGRPDSRADRNRPNAPTCARACSERRTVGAFKPKVSRPKLSTNHRPASSV